MIKYNLNNIDDWFFNEADIIKVYRNNAVCYYKITSSGGTSGQTPCFDVVDDISQYSDTEFEDVYASGNTTWYKLNNLSQYEEYGVYETTTATTYYDGKLVIMNGHEYEYSGGSWNDLGETSGSSRLPMGYAEIEYVENTSRAFINTGFRPDQDTEIVLTTQCVTSTSGGRQIGSGGYDGVNAIQYDYENGATGTLHISWGGYAGWATYSDCVGDYDKHTYNWVGNEFWRDKDTANEFYATTAGTTFQCTDNLAIFTRYQNGSGGGDGEAFKGKVFDFQMYDNGTLVRDLVPAKRESDSTYGAYDIVNDVFYSSANNYALTGGSEVSPIVYPEYYTDKTAPPNNVTFTSMTEAESYECPWVGMRATIDGSGYIFSGDSQSGYEWVYTPSRLPAGYIEIEYVENTGTSYFNTNFIPNQDTRVVCDMQLVTSTRYPRLWGAGAWNSATGIMPNYEGGYLQMSWLGNTSWTKYTSVPTSFDRKVYDVNKNYLYVDNVEIGSNTYTTKTASDPIGVFTYIGSGIPSSSSYWGQEHFKGKMFSFKIYDNGTLVRDLVPCINPSNVVGAYDIVNDVFYSVPTGYTTDTLVAGNPV